MYKALKDGRIGGAALDVFNVAPLPNDSPFLQLENITLTPHLAGHSLNSMITPFEILGKEIDRFLKFVFIYKWRSIKCEWWIPYGLRFL
ncbi:MAG TPA: hypothetical protein ENG48_03020 [Candidatus Atribacteria bacterium]|nr:hypothetical protein [Candidatus Atribacteria bacterium]